jgi:N utilization substance protein A
MSENILKIIEHLEKEKGIERESLIQAIEAALLTACKKRLGEDSEPKVHIDRKRGTISIACKKKVVKQVLRPQLEVSLPDALKISPDLKEGDVCEAELTMEDFGRIAAQTAKQVMIQKIREAEKDMVFQEFKPREGEIISGVVGRFDHGNVILNVGKAEAILPHNERSPGEEFKRGERIKVHVLEVRKIGRGPQLVVSRSNPGLIRQLFELEVPEIKEGVVEIKSVAREAGDRTKICVHSKMENVDCVGACVGVKGSRVKNIINELGREKIDIIPWSEDPKVFISNALSPAKILNIDINEKEGASIVSVKEEQLSLAIGKGGQNARLAAKLTGWKIDIKVLKKAEELSLPGISEKIRARLIEAGVGSIEDIVKLSKEKLTAIKGIGEKTAEKVLKAAGKKTEDAGS